MSKDWHLHKAVPISIIILLLSSLLGFAYKSGTITARVFANAEDIVEIQLEKKESNKVLNDISRAVARIEGALNIKK